MKHFAFAFMIVCWLGSHAFAQVVPAATGMTPTATRAFSYAFRYAENVQFDTKLPTMQTSIVSGTLGFANRSIDKPFIMNYAGGYTWTLSGPDYQTGQFHRMFLSQGFNSRRWKFLAQDSVAYLPQTPTIGFSGVPGTGEVIGSPDPAPSTNLSILAFNTHVLNNSALVNVEHTLSFATTAVFGGGSDILYFPNGDGINTRSISGNGQIARRLTGRTTLGGRYLFTQFEYPGSSVVMRTNTVLGGIQHRITRTLTASAFVGPQWINSTVATLVPTQTSYAANASLNYAKRLTSFGVNYFHGTNGGSGYLIGGTLDDIQGNYLYQFNRDIALGFNGGYQRTAAFNSIGVTNASYGATQLTWQAGRNVIVFGSYTGRGQTSSSLLPGNVLNETINTLSFGFGLSPRAGRGRP